MRIYRWKINIIIILLILLIALNLGLKASADSLITTEHQITTSYLNEKEPALGSDIIVYAQAQPYDGRSDIIYQPLVNGVATGSSIAVTSTPGIGEEIPDTSGNYIVYSSDHEGIVIYRISDAATWSFGDPSYVRSPHIEGNWIVWNDTSQVMLYNLNNLGSTVQPEPISGYPAFEPEIGDRFAVWIEQNEIGVWDLANSTSTLIGSADNDIMPATSGAWIAWVAINDAEETSTRIEAINMDNNEHRLVINDGSYNVLPRIHGDLIAWHNNKTGNFDIWVYRLSNGDRFKVTNQPQPNRYMKIQMDFSRSAFYHGTISRAINPPLDLSACNSVNLNLSPSEKFRNYVDDIAINLKMHSGAYTTASTDTLGNISIDRADFDDPSFGVVNYIVIVINSSSNEFISSASAFIDDISCTTDIGSIVIDNFEGYTYPNFNNIWHYFYDVESATLEGDPDHLMASVYDNMVAYQDNRAYNSDVWISTLEFIFENVPPVAKAYMWFEDFRLKHVDMGLLKLDEVFLFDCERSWDPDNDDIVSCSWKLESKPLGSLAAFNHPVYPGALQFDLPGLYIVSLVVNDGYVDSLPSYVTIEVHDTDTVDFSSYSMCVHFDTVADADSDADVWVAITEPSLPVQGETNVETSTTSFGATGFYLDTGIYYNITTTTTYTGDVIVSIKYDDSSLTIPEEDLRLCHYEEIDAGPPPTWACKDVTILPVDTDNNIISGRVSSLSWFAIGIPDDDEPCEKCPYLIGIGIGLFLLCALIYWVIKQKKQ